MKTAAWFINKLKLEKHPEGGWYREIYRSDDVISPDGKFSAIDGDRSFCTSIYYLLEKDEFSALHRIKSDEIWHLYDGNSAVEIIILDNEQLTKVVLGRDLDNDHQPQIVVPKNKWFAARLVNADGFALMGCTVSPGFHFQDFELADDSLLHKYPDLKEEILPLLIK